jgi:hypothetical protein
MSPKEIWGQAGSCRASDGAGDRCRGMKMPEKARFRDLCGGSGSFTGPGAFGRTQDG